MKQRRRKYISTVCSSENEEPFITPNNLEATRFSQDFAKKGIDCSLNRGTMVSNQMVTMHGRVLEQQNNAEETVKKNKQKEGGIIDHEKMLFKANVDIQRSMMTLKSLNNSNDFHKELINGKQPIECELVPDLPTCFKIYCGGEMAPCMVKVKYWSEGNLQVCSSLTDKEPTICNCTQKANGRPELLKIHPGTDAKTKFPLSQQYLYLTLWSLEGLRITL